MPRRRADPSIPSRMYFKHSSWYYVHHDMRWERLGPDFEAAKKRAETYNGTRPSYGTMSYWLDEWLKHLDERLKAKTLAERTRDDYKEAVPLLKAYLGSIEPQSVAPHHVATYLELGLQADRAVRANREKSALSSAMTWMVAKGHGGLKVNPCLAVKRNTETKRVRYVSDAEYKAVYRYAGPAERAWMELMYRTLQRPSDILAWTTDHIVRDGVKKVLTFRQGKTERLMRIELTETLQDCLAQLGTHRKKRSALLIPREDGGQYTEQGIASMFRAAVYAADLKDLAPYDMKAKGATDLYQAGTPLEQIQALCGHESVRTTEVYIKRHLNVVVQPNDRKIR